MTVTFHRLGVRHDGDEWIVGRVDSGDFVAVPEEGLLAIRLLQQGMDVEQARVHLLEETGTDLDVADFVAALSEAGLVAEVEGHPIPGPAWQRPTFPWLQPRHVRWTLHPALHLALLGPIGTGIACLVLRPAIFPGWEAVLWTDHGAAVLLTWAVVAWLTTGLHELAHLLTARAASVPARMSLGTRLQFLVAQTDVSGIWVAPTRIRVTVYLAGTAVDLTISGMALTWVFAIGPNPIVSWVILIQTLRLANQFLVFMRTDLYFLLQDVTGCRNLYGSGAAYVVGLLRGRRNTLASLPPRERLSVRLYAVLQSVGTLACLSFAVLVTLPLVVTLIVHSVQDLLGAKEPWAMAEAVVVLALIIIPDLLWARAWWRRHGRRVRRAAATAGSAVRTLSP
ncbi:hypothetical protein E1295_36130 [Nonomuraea mesophila]|uniref:PqqD family protein n=1 Tax=Nonomuraea mesophila TaxID=2530382 RepID=A0A4R5ELZ8_9ACTN|nr:hypothetical protein [Nonomuraea mesophila]TDE35363.1 hypothetical protein E1295_36130 [Nonomuraea mesophila]